MRRRAQRRLKRTGPNGAEASSRSIETASGETGKTNIDQAVTLSLPYIQYFMPHFYFYPLVVGSCLVYSDPCRDEKEPGSVPTALFPNRRVLSMQGCTLYFIQERT